MVAEKVETLSEGIEVAAASIDNSLAKAAMLKLVEISNLDV